MSAYRFGPFVLDVQERRLLGDGMPVALTPKTFDTLVYLVERHGHLVAKDELMAAIWGGAYVEEGNLSRTVHVLRKALGSVGGEDGVERQYIETLPTKGYRFVADVTREDASTVSVAVPTAKRAGESESRSGARPWSGQWPMPWVVGVLLVLTLAAALWLVRDRQSTAAVPGGALLDAPTASGAAYVRYQQGRLHLERHLPGDIETALQDFEAAIDLDPTFATAHAGRADALFFRFWDTGAHDDIALARRALRQALDIQPGSSYAHGLLCRLLATYDWDFAGAEAECRRAVDLDPRNHEARRELAFLLSAVGRRDEALKEADAAVAIAPTSFNKRSRGVLLYFERRFDEAIAQLRQVEATDPDYGDVNRWIARAFEQAKDFEHALEYFVRQRASAGASTDEIAPARRAFATGGWPAVLRASLPPAHSASTLDAAGTLAQLGEVDAAFDALAAMISARRVMTVHIDSDPRLDPLRSDRRFDQLAARVGLR